MNHPHIIRMLETLESPKRIHIVMEHAGGGNLCQYVKARKRLGEADARAIFVQILLAVEYLHTTGIVHRDIKLENVLFDDNRGMKLVDFGFSVGCRYVHVSWKWHSPSCLHAVLPMHLVTGVVLGSPHNQPQRPDKEAQDLLWDTVLHGARDCHAAAVRRTSRRHLEFGCASLRDAVRHVPVRCQVLSRVVQKDRAGAPPPARLYGEYPSPPPLASLFHLGLRMRAPHMHLCAVGSRLCFHRVRVDMAAFLTLHAVCCLTPVLSRVSRSPTL